MPHFCLHVISNFLREGYNQGKISDDITDKNLTILHATDMRSHSHQQDMPSTRHAINKACHQQGMPSTSARHASTRPFS
jgi:hypothetical protein